MKRNNLPLVSCGDHHRDFHPNQKGGCHVLRWHRCTFEVEHDFVWWISKAESWAEER